MKKAKTMRTGKKITLIGASILIVLLITLFAPLLQGKGAPVICKATPVGTQIYVDDVLVGQSPAKLRLSAGTHQFRFEYPYFKTARIESRVGYFFSKELAPSLEVKDPQGLLIKALGSLRVWALAGPFDTADYPYPMLISTTLDALDTGPAAAASARGANANADVSVADDAGRDNKTDDARSNAGGVSDARIAELSRAFVMQAIAQAKDEAIWQDLNAAIAARPALRDNTVINEILERAGRLREQLTQAAGSDASAAGDATGVITSARNESVAGNASGDAALVSGELMAETSWQDFVTFIAEQPEWSAARMQGDSRVDEHYLDPLSRGLVAMTDPLSSVSRYAVEAYAAWLSERDGVSYRLPSEAELREALVRERAGVEHKATSSKAVQAWYWTSDLYEPLLLGLNQKSERTGSFELMGGSRADLGLSVVVGARDHMKSGIYNPAWCPPVVRVRLVREK